MYQNLYFSKRFPHKKQPQPVHIKNVTIIGGGAMGSGMAQVIAHTGYNVVLVERTPELLNRAKYSIGANVIADRIFNKHSPRSIDVVEEVLGRIHGVTTLEDGVVDADFVIESVFEKMELKQKLFKIIDGIAPARTIFASNTSSLSIAEIADVTKRKDRFIGMHFFLPVQAKHVVEIVRTNETSLETYQAVLKFGSNIGKTVVTCRDTPGFIVSRLLVPYLAEAVRMLERGDATPIDIDTAMKLAFGFPVGPIEYIDFVGLDAMEMILTSWHKRFPDNPYFIPPPKLIKMVRKGKLGRKSGEGFYKYKKI